MTIAVDLGRKATKTKNKMYSCALDFFMEAKVMNLDQTASLEVGPADN